MIWKQERAAATWISSGRLSVVMGSSGTVLNETKHGILHAEQLQESITVYTGLKSETGLILLHFVVKKGTLLSRLLVPNTLQS